MRINLNGNDILKLVLIYLGIIVIVIFLNSCSAERKVLADIEKVKRVRAVTDALFPCVTEDSLVFIHDSTIIETVKRDTLVKEYNDTTYYFITDTVTKIRKVTQQTWKTDLREVNKLNDSLTAIRLREAAANGKLLQSQNETQAQSKSRKQWMAYTIGLSVIAALLVAIIVMMLGKRLPIKL